MTAKQLKQLAKIQEQLVKLAQAIPTDTVNDGKNFGLLLDAVNILAKIK